MNSNQQLGRTGTDSITGFSGIIIGVVSYLTGCRQCLIQPKGEKPHECPDSKWIDEDRLAISGEPLQLPATSTGFDKAAPRR